MSVLLDTTIGDIVIDLHTEFAPKSCLNFLKLCKVKYYNFAPVYNVQKRFSFQTGDPLGPDGDGGTSIWGLLGGGPRFFPAEINPRLRHSSKGTVSMAVSNDSKEVGSGVSGSQFFITLGDDLDYLDGKFTIFGRVAEGFDTLDKINEAYCDDKGRPYKDIRIKHTIILEDPYDDPPGLIEPPESPVPTKAQLATVRIGEDEDLQSDDDEDAAEKKRREREARAQALTLEMVGDLPFAEMRPPENVLFVCKLNPVTSDEDLELIFSRFGKILSCQVIRDKKTRDSLQYAFIEFDTQTACEQAYFKMQDVLIDDHRIHVDFSQGIVRNWNQRHDPSKIDFDSKRPNRQPSKHSSSYGGGRHNFVFDHDDRSGPRYDRHDRDRRDRDSRDRSPPRHESHRYPHGSRRHESSRDRNRYDTDSRDKRRSRYDDNDDYYRRRERYRSPHRRHY